MFKNTLFFPVDELIFDVKFFFFLFFFFPRVNHWSFMLCSQETILAASRRKEIVELLFPGAPLPSLFSTINVRHLSFQGNYGREENFPFQKGKYFASFRRAAHQIF